MQRKNIPVIFYIIIALAAIGLIANILTNPTGLFKNIFMMVGVGAAMFALVYFLFLKRRGAENDEMKKYKQALKQSKRKHQATQMQQPIYHPTKAKHKRASHLRVIDGNKSKRKNRATH